MGNQAVVVELLGSNRDGEPRRFTIADAEIVKKGDLMVMTDPRTCTSAAATSSMAISAAAGIAAEDKAGGEGIVSITLWTDGIFDLVCSGGIFIGESIGFMGGNVVGALFSPLSFASGAAVAGYTMESIAATGGATETINVRLRL